MATPMPPEEIIKKTGYQTDGRKTFVDADDLPALPVPPLKQTLDRYLRSAKPFLTDQEYRKTEEVVRNFERNPGPELQKKLLEYAKDKRNWLEKWWLEEVYLILRSPLVPLMNFAGPAPYFFHAWPAQEGSQVSRAAFSAHYFLRYWQLLRREQIRPDMSSSGDKWCMNQYMRMFNGCRIPREKYDTFTCKFKLEKDGPCPHFVTVICKGRLFKMPAVDDNGDPYTPLELERSLNLIMEACSRGTAGASLCPMTTENRDTWAKVRQHLVSLHPDNLRNLETIQDSIFCLILDDARPTDYDSLAIESLAGNCNNHWYDKHICSTIYQNGLVSVNCDHAPYDAIVIAFMAHFCDICINLSEGQWTGTKAVRDIPRPKELIFRMDDTIHRAIDTARDNYCKAVANVDVISPMYKGLGKKWLRSRKLHPDTFIQVALQYAYRKMMGKPAATYETATTRQFYHGRTETVRSCTMEMMDFAQAMMSSSTSDKDKHNKLLAAIKKHLSLMGEAYNGQGIDRHLLGLQLVAMREGLPMPDLYTDPAYKKSGGGGNYILSTSFIGYTAIHGGVAAMCENGYGFFYCIEQNRVKFFISSWKSDKESDNRRLYNTISQCLDEMKALLERVAPSAAKM